MSAFKTDGTYTAATATAKPTFSQPFDGVNTDYILRQPFQILNSSYAPLGLNTAHPDFSSFKLVQETERQPLGEGLVKWERVYAKTPSQRIELSTMNYNFIGYWGVILANTSSALATGEVPGRSRFPKAVLVKQQFDYYLVDGSIIVTQYDIPVVAEQRYLGPYTGVDGQPVDINFLNDTVMGLTHFVAATTPSYTAYKAMVTADAGTASSFSIAAQNSSVRRWMGNIWERETLYVKAI